MKTNNTIFRTGILSTAALLLFSCSTLEHDNFGYKPADGVSFSQVTDLGKTEQDGLNVYDILLSGGTDELFLRFYGTDWYLSNVIFTPTVTPAKEHYSQTDSYFQKGGQKHAIEKGGVNVSSSGNEYTFSGVLWLDNGETVKISAKGELVYEHVVLEYTQAFPPVVTAVDAGYNIQLILATDGIEQKNMGAWMEYPGSGQYLLLELISATPELHSGVFTIAEDTSYGVGNYLSGYGIEVDLSEYGMGIVTSHQHSRIMDVVDGVEILNAYLTAGKVTVTETEAGFDIEVDAEKQFAVFSGSIPGMGNDQPGPDPDPDPEPDIPDGFTETISDVTAFDFSVFAFVKVEGVEKHTLTLYQGGAQVAQMEVITAEGGSILDHPAGFTMSSTSNEPGTWVPGWDGTMAGMDGYQGSYIVDGDNTWFVQEEGATLYINAPQEGDDKYMFYGTATQGVSPDGSASAVVTVFWQLPYIEPEGPDAYFTETVSDVTAFDFSVFAFVKVEGVEKHTMQLFQGGAQIAQLEVITAEGGSILDFPDGYNMTATSNEPGVWSPGWDGTMAGMDGLQGSYIVSDGRNWLLQEEGKTLYISSADGVNYNFYGGVVNGLDGEETKALSVIYQMVKK